MPAHKKQFCPAGHDTHVVGRYGNSACVQCTKERTAARSEEIAEYNRRPDVKRRYAPKRKAWKKANPEKVRLHEVKQKYGLSEEQLLALMQVQQSRCAICEALCTLQGSTAFNVDHDHLTGKVRGLLCGDCNRGIGLLRDSSTICAKAAQYLEKSK